MPQELEWILAQGLARDRDARYPTARDFGRDLTRFLYRFGRPVSEYEVAELVRATMGLEALSPVDGTQKIAELIDMMLLEFKSLSDGSEVAPLSAMQPESYRGFEEDGGGADEPLGGLADELEGPDPEPGQTQEAPGVTGWFRGLIR